MVSESEIRKFLDFNFGISKDFKGKKCGIELKLATDFHHKIILTGYTLYYIFYPRPNDIFENLSKRAVTYDFPSAYSLLRVIFEAYVNAYFILFGAESDGENKYRILRWDIHELKERLKLAEIIKSTNSQVDEMKKELEGLKDKLKTNNYFMKFNEKMKKDILNSNNWSKKNINEKVKCTEINPTISGYLYKYTSNFIHSDPVSLAQLHAVSTQEEIDILLNVPKKFILMFSALALDILMSLSDEIKNTVNKNKDMLDTVTLYKSLSKLKFEEIST